MARGFPNNAGGSKRVEFATSRGIPLTMAMWGKQASYTAQYACYFNVSGDTSNDTIGFWTNPSSKWYYQSHEEGTATADITDSTAATYNRWYALVGRSSASNAHEFDVYDPVADRTFNGTSTTNTPGLILDAIAQGNADYFGYGYGCQGYWAETAIWSAVLTDDEVLAFQSGVAPSLIRPESLVFYDPSIRDLRPDQIGGVTGTESATVTIADHPPGIIREGGLWVPGWYGVGAGPAGGSLHLTPAMRHHYMSILEQ